MLNPKVSVLCVTTSLLALLAGAPQALAQSEPTAGPIDQVVVTARKRGEESLQDVPATITAFGEDALDRLGVAGGVATEHDSLPRGRRQHPAQHADDGRLAAAVGAE